MKRCLMAAALAATAVAPALAADNDTAILTELRRLAARVEVLEQQNHELRQALATDRVSEREPELATRLKAVEFQTLSMQKQVKQIDTLDGVSVSASLTGVAQKLNRDGAVSGERESRANYRADIAVTLPGGKMGDVEGKIFAHLRAGQGNGVGMRPTYTSTANTTAFEVGSTPGSDSFGILAQAWYQLSVPLPLGGYKAHSREELKLTFGKIDPFVFFDQNAAADDESAKFLNNVFVHNPLLDSGGDVGADAYGFTPGGIVEYVNSHDKNEVWRLSLGVFGSGPAADFSGSLAAPFVIAQAGRSTRINALPGNYRAYLWTNGRAPGYDGIERRHSGLGISIDQKVDDALTLFGRYGHQLKGRVRFDRALTAGAEFGGDAWGRSADSLGVAFGALRTSASFRNDSGADADGDGIPDLVGYAAGGVEKLAEVYYRAKINSNFELTPDFQYVKRPAGDSSAPAIKVLGLRAKVGF